MKSLIISILVPSVIFVSVILVALCCLLLASLAHRSQTSMRNKLDYANALRYGIENIQLAKAFDQNLPSTRHFITYFWDDEQIWNSNAFLHGRYILVYQHNCRWLDEQQTFTMISQPTIMLLEVELIEPQSHGGFRTKYGMSWMIEEDDLLEILMGVRTFSDIGIAIRTDSPVEHFYLIEHRNQDDSR